VQRDPAVPSTERPASEGGRVLGIDVARAVAVVGMVMVHFGPTDPQQGAPFGEHLYALSHGRASVLFVLLAGIGVTLLAGDRSRDRLRRTWVRLGWRAAVLLPLGLGLQLLDHGVAVILQYYAVYFVVAGAAVLLDDRLLLAAAVALSVVGPLVYLAGWHLQPGWYELGPTSLDHPPAVIVRQLLLTGWYPTIVWSAPLLVGVWLGRRTLASTDLQRRMVGWGCALALTAWGASQLLVVLVGEPEAEPSWRLLATDTPHSAMPLWLLGATGSAIAVLGLCLLVSKVLPRLTWPVAAAGQLAFTIYVGHVLVLARWPDLLRYDAVGDAASSVVRFTVVAIGAAAAWRLVMPRGPLELALRPPWTWGRGGSRTDR
jgi:hypothetical protein